MNTRVLVGLGVLGAGVVLLMRKQIGGLISMAMDEASKEIFRAALPARAQPYADLILQVSEETGVSPFLIFGLGDRESNWGLTLSPRGPGGTGDSGHGRGLMQIDDRAFTSWVNSNDWRDPLTNIRKGVAILQQNLNFFSSNTGVDNLTDGTTVTVSEKQAARRGVEAGDYEDPRPLTDIALWDAAISAYNTGVGNVLMSLAVGVDTDTTSTGGDYASDVMRRLTELAASVQSAGGTMA